MVQNLKNEISQKGGFSFLYQIDDMQSLDFHKLLSQLNQLIQVLNNRIGKCI